MNYELLISTESWQSIIAHVLPENAVVESAAFLFARTSATESVRALAVFDHYLAQPADFARQHGDYLELTDTARIRLLKHAHHSQGAIVEVHSHPWQRVAEFSWADRAGFRECVPQMLWRLDQKPYAAIVIAPTTFDALVWWDSETPASLNRVLVNGRGQLPTNQTFGALSDHRRAI
jgi:hypothetical protein